MKELRPRPWNAGDMRKRKRGFRRSAFSVLAGLLWLSAAAEGFAGEWELFDAQGRYRGRLEQSPDRQEIERFDAEGRYLGRYERSPDGWNVFGADGSYHGRIERVPGMDEPYR